jgi:hypothetical protein
VILADGDLPGAPLHTAVGVENEEGVTDLLLYGSSPFRVTRRIEGEEFLLITAGTVVADPEKVYRHDRWQGLLAAFRESGCVLVLYLPSDLPGYDALLSEGDRVLRLCGSTPIGDPEPGVLILVPEVNGEAPLPVVATAAPLTDAVSDSEMDLIEILVDEDEGADALLEAVEEVEREARAAAARRAVAGSTLDAPADVHLPSDDVHQASETKEIAPRPVATRRAPWILLLVLVAIGTLLVLAWLGFLRLPTISSNTSRAPDGGEIVQLLTLHSFLG